MFFKSLLLANAIISSVFAARLDVPSFGPDVNMAPIRDFDEPAQFYTLPSAEDPVKIATDFATTRVKISQGFSFVVKNSYKSSSTEVTHVYMKQTFQGAEIVNGDMNINVDKFGRVTSYGLSFFDGEAPSELPDLSSLALENGQHIFSPNPADVILTPAEAVAQFARFLKIENVPSAFEMRESLLPDGQDTLLNANGLPVFVVSNPFAEVQMTQRYLIVQKPAYKIIAVWDMAVDMKNSDNWFNAQMNIQTGEVAQLVDWVSSAAYNVYPIGVNDPTDGDRQLVSSPEDEVASPLGWHNQGSHSRAKTPKDTTIGNNVYAQANPDGRGSYENNFRPTGKQVGEELTFDFDLDLTKEPKDYINASITNLFYWNNIMHDVFYQYGFDEKSGNFQEDNFNRGGRDGDAVIANAQDGSGYNNANFATPPDGNKGRMRMYIWTVTKPSHDGDLEAGIVIHEYGHGISNRLTGGPANSNCLGWGEAGGMGEGWSDTFATFLRMKAHYNSSMDFGMGEYSANRGIRPFPYSTSLKTNPHTYSWIRKDAYSGRVHAIGSVWASILYEVYWEIVNKHGFNPNWYAVKTDEKKTWAGNLRALQLIVDGMKLQPCRPNFVDARNAIIKADETGFDGEHFCLLWKAFAKRGLGLKAIAGGVDSFEVPTECQ